MSNHQNRNSGFPIFVKDQRKYARYQQRCVSREMTLMEATTDFVEYFIGLGDTQEDAELKVGQVSDEVAATLYQYRLGRTQPLIDGINASTLPFMDAAAKAFLVNALTPTP
jgi:hypothetical protein